MKRHMMKFNFLLAGALLLTACSKDTVDNNTKQQEGLVFTMSEAPYNADVDVATRASTPEIIKDTLDFGGVEAEVTLERDAVQPAPTTRAVTSGNHYTIVAFKAGTSQAVAEMKGYFDTGTGAFKYESGSDMIRIPAGNYDFACYTHQYATRVGNKVTIPLANADKAFVCRAENVTINKQKRQEVAFTMKHAGVRLRTKLIAMMEPTGVVGSLGYKANATPAAAVYDLATGTFSGSIEKVETTQLEAQSYDISGTIYDTNIQDNQFTLTGNQYITSLAGIKPEELFYQFTAGSVYKANINSNGLRKLKAASAFEANGVYTLTIKLLPKYIYLFEDGQTGSLRTEGRKEHIPIALVFAPHKAIALWDANGGNYTNWSKTENRLHNSEQVEDFTNTKSGTVWTWESYNSLGNGNMVKAEDKENFPAFYHAGNFYASTDLTGKLQGKSLAHALRQPDVWYLGSAYEWRELFLNICYADPNDLYIQMPMPADVSPGLITYAFTAGFNPAYSMPCSNYWTSMEREAHKATGVVLSSYNVAFFDNPKNSPNGRLRAFVSF